MHTCIYVHIHIYLIFRYVSIRNMIRYILHIKSHIYTVHSGGIHERTVQEEGFRLACGSLCFVDLCRRVRG